MIYSGELRKVSCTICGCDIKEANLYDSTSISDLFYTDCPDCGFEIDIEHGDDWSRVKPSYTSCDFKNLPSDQLKTISNLIKANENKIYSDSHIEYHKSENAITGKIELIRYDKFTKNIGMRQAN